MPTRTCVTIFARPTASAARACGIAQVVIRGESDPPRRSCWTFRGLLTPRPAEQLPASLGSEPRLAATGDNPPADSWLIPNDPPTRDRLSPRHLLGVRNDRLRCRRRFSGQTPSPGTRPRRVRKHVTAAVHDGSRDQRSFTTECASIGRSGPAALHRCGGYRGIDCWRRRRTVVRALPNPRAGTAFSPRDTRQATPDVTTRLPASGSRPV